MSDKHRTSKTLAYAIRGSDNTTEVCLTETDALMKGLKLSKLFPTVTFSVVELIEKPADEPKPQPSKTLLRLAEKLRRATTVTYRSHDFGSMERALDTVLDGAARVISDLEKMSARDAAEPSATPEDRARDRMVQAFPKLNEFFSKYALGTLLPPSCFVCGQTVNGPDEIAISHAELSGIVCCFPCRDAAQRARASEPPSDLRVRQLENMRTLKAGWDSYGALPILPELIDKGHELLRVLPGDWTPVPCADGTIQLERNADGFNMELRIDLAEVRQPETKYAGTPGFPRTPELERSARRDRYPPRDTAVETSATRGNE